MSRTQVLITPADHGRRMSLDEFECAEGQEGHLYELGRGVIVVTDVPNPKHFAQLMVIKRAFMRHDFERPGSIHAVAGGAECKILARALQSERHPDLSIYLTPMPPIPDRRVWSAWIPEIVVEIVSRGSGKRDYDEKPEEYLAVGVSEYLIVDAARQTLTVLTRTPTGWAPRTLTPADYYQTPLLPGLTLPVADIFAPARGTE